MPTMIRDSGLGTEVAEEYLGNLVKSQYGKNKKTVKRKKRKSASR